ncbi:MAG: Ppx/GppA family phosphatase [Nitrospinae bacterium]|nr:Ppx/GppA family phosphatase [Nitrospinota bacterium]
MILASIDIGTNTTRLLIVEANTPSSFRRIYSDRVITRLGGGFSQNGRITYDAMERVRRVLSDFKDKIDNYKCEKVSAVATSVVREAKNRDEFIKKVRERTGIEIEVISWQEEARRTLLGVFMGIPNHIESGLVYDIGGGSTEFILTKGRRPVRFFGTDLGVVHLAERYIYSDPIKEDEYKRLEEEIEKKILKVRSEIYCQREEVIGYEGEFKLIGTAGTITTLAAIDMDLFPYDSSKINGHIISINRINEILNDLMSRTLEERRDIPSIERGREDIIIPGSIIVIKTMEILGFEEMIVSDFGLREGIILNMLERGDLQ